jgi:hypothetical protein
VTVDFPTQTAALAFYNTYHKMGFQVHLYYGAVAYKE